MVKDLIHALEGVLLGKPETVELLVMALLADGHVLVEDVPGTGKTTLAKAPPSVQILRESSLRRICCRPT